MFFAQVGPQLRIGLHSFIIDSEEEREDLSHSFERDVVILWNTDYSQLWYHREHFWIPDTVKVYFIENESPYYLGFPLLMFALISFIIFVALRPEMAQPVAGGDPTR